MKKSYFITGTDTGVGKTLLASAIVHLLTQKGIKAVGMKPVAAGCVKDKTGTLLSEDVAMLMSAGKVFAPLELRNPYAFEPPIAPHIAASQAGVVIRPEVITQAYEKLERMADSVIVEGVGGFRVPLSTGFDTADLAKTLDLRVIMVVGMRLGCLNHALLTAEAIRARGLSLRGWIANRIDDQMPAFEENLQALETLIDAPCLGKLPYLPQPDFRKAAGYLSPDI